SCSTCPESIMNGSATSPAGRRDRNPTGVVVVHSDDDGLLGGEIATPRKPRPGTSNARPLTSSSSRPKPLFPATAHQCREQSVVRHGSIPPLLCRPHH